MDKTETEQGGDEIEVEQPLNPPTQGEPFDPDNRCPKCGSDNVATQFRADSHAYNCVPHRVPRSYDSSDRLSCSGCGDEHFDRLCRRCHHDWREEVVGTRQATRADLRASYEAKVQDFAAETLRSAAAWAAIRRIMSPILLAARLHAAPLFSGDFFAEGFPPNELEALRTALGDEWAAVLSLRLEPGHSGVLRFEP